MRGYFAETRDSFLIEKKANVGLSQSDKIKVRVHDECSTNLSKYARADLADGKSKKCNRKQVLSLRVL